MARFPADRPSKTGPKSVGSDKNCWVNYEPVGHQPNSEVGCGLKMSVPPVAWRGQASILDRFWARVHKTPTCWHWTGLVVSRYGQISLGHPSTPGSKRWKAHRFSWELHHGPIPVGLNVCHRCDNCLCVNPDHLFLGTQKQNVHDAIHKGRRNAFGQQKLTPEDVYVIRAQAARGMLQKDIASAFSIARNTVSGIVRRKSWGHLPVSNARTA